MIPPLASRDEKNKYTAGAVVPGTQSGEERLTGMLEVHAAAAEELEGKLKEAIDVVTKAAAQHHIGVLVTPTGPDRYVVRAHPAVPFGLIRQQPSGPCR